MSLINPVLLYGLGLAVVPVILHLLLKAKPKRLPFPALRLIRPRQTHNVRRLRLRQVGLLLLRMAVIGLIALALARPSLPAANYSFNAREAITLAAILVLACGAYAAFPKHWQRSGVAAHEMRYRRTMLKAGVGTGTALLFLLLVAWPYGRRVAGEVTGVRPNVAGELPVACVYVFDTSMSMEYRRDNKTRLDAAKAIAREHRSRLPPHSRIAVADTSGDNPIPFQADAAGAQDRIDKLQVRPVGVPLNRRVRTALELQAEDYRRTLDSAATPAGKQDRYVREIYVFTDLAKSGWQISASNTMAAELARMPNVGMYVIDVGITEPENTGITGLALPKQTVALGGDLSLEATLEAAGVDERNQAVELFIYGESGELIKQGQSTVSVGRSAARRVAFSVSGLTSRITQGEVRLLSSDPLSMDDVRYFTVQVLPPPEILVIGDNVSRSLYWSEALAPEELVKKGRANYRCRSIPIGKLAETDLTAFDVVCLVGAVDLSAQSWNKLAEHVEQGGGLAVFLGSHDLNSVSYNSPEARAVLPAELVAPLRFPQSQFLDLANNTHVLIQGLADSRFPTELGAVPMYRFWKVTPAADATVVASYADADRTPAIVDRALGKGRVVLVTTAAGNVDWNELPQSWSYLVFADRLMHYLGRHGDNVFNYTAGEAVTVRLDPARPMESYLLRKPKLEQRPGKVPANAQVLTIEDADQLGHYELVPQKPAGEFRAGFSVNPQPGESDFTRLTKDLDRLFGENRYSVARDLESLAKSVQMGRLGVEVFPILLCLMLVAFCAEHIIANRFYREERGGIAVAPPGAVAPVMAMER